MTSLVAWWSELLTANHEVPGSITEFSFAGEYPQSDHGLGSFVELRFKAPPNIPRSHHRGKVTAP
jgi:hypothetical protein